MGRSRVDVSSEVLEAFCGKWRIAELSLFGSVLRDDFRPESDIDILIEFAEDAHWSLYEWLDMSEELQAIFGRTVDLTSKRGLRNPFRKKEILDTREVIYAS
jgi:predicted nucleotidyltransferase